MDPYRNYHGDKREMPCATFATWDMLLLCGEEVRSCSYFLPFH